MVMYVQAKQNPTRANPQISTTTDLLTPLTRRHVFRRRGPRASSVGSSLSLSTGKHGGWCWSWNYWDCSRSRCQRLAREAVPGPCLQAHLLLLALPAAVCTEATMMLQKKLHVS